MVSAIYRGRLNFFVCVSHHYHSHTICRLISAFLLVYSSLAEICSAPQLWSTSKFWYCDSMTAIKFSTLNYLLIPAWWTGDARGVWSRKSTQVLPVNHRFLPVAITRWCSFYCITLHIKVTIVQARIVSMRYCAIFLFTYHLSGSGTALGRRVCAVNNFRTKWPLTSIFGTPV